MLKSFSEETFDVILQAGQSNAEGTGCGPVDVPYKPNDTVWYMTNDFVISRGEERVSQNETVGDFALSFADRYRKDGLLEPGRKILILRTAVGGTGFRDHRWGMTDDLYLQMMEMIRTALSLNPKNRLVAFLWHQGETDAINKATYEEHLKNLTALLSSVREEFQVPGLPFLAADFVQNWKSENLEICEPVVRAIRDFCNTCGNGAFVETDGLLSNYQALGRNTLGWNCADKIHFSRQSLGDLGVRYYEAFRAL